MIDCKINRVGGDTGKLKIMVNGSVIDLLVETTTIVLSIAKEVERIKDKSSADFFRALLSAAMNSDEFCGLSENLSSQDEEGVLS